MTAPDLAPCARCGALTPIHLLDAKPSPGDHTPADLAAAADCGENFERLECAACYGPGYLPGELAP